MRKKVYIAGKIGKEFPSEATFIKFEKAERQLLSKGYETFNPTNSSLGATADALAKLNGTDFYREIMLLDLQELARCDATGWIERPGAEVEFRFAKAIGLEIMYKNYDKDE